MCYGYTDRSSERGLAIQAILTENGFVIHEKQRGFNRYLGAKSIGSSSDLYRLRATPKVHVQEVDIARSSFYTGQKQH